MYKGKMTFSRIAGIIHRDDSHRITARIGRLHSRRMKRLESLGVRSTIRPPVNIYDMSEDRKRVYDQAYNALKRSNKPWATETEIRAILYGDKELSHERSAEVIEILRRARILGFKETDEVTSGDVYSERVLGALGRQDRDKIYEKRRKRIEELIKHDRDKIEVEERDDHDYDETDDALKPIKIVKLETPDTQPRMETGRGSTVGGRYHDQQSFADRSETDALPSRRIPLPHESYKRESSKSEPEQTGEPSAQPQPKALKSEKTPLTFGLEDSDLEDTTEED